MWVWIYAYLGELARTSYPVKVADTRLCTIILCGWSILAALARVGVTRVHHIYPVRTADTRRAS